MNTFFVPIIFYFKLFSISYPQKTDFMELPFLAKGGQSSIDI